jgi:flagellar basal-body rod modification protein FlgD
MNALQASSATASASSVLGTSGKSDTNKADEAQDRFLKLLVTQMKNQDPLNPLDNAQVTSQLAQLSTVSGIEKLNTTVASLETSYQTSQALQSANLIGRGVLVPGKDVNLEKGRAAFGVEITEPADNVKVVVRDANNRAVHTVDLGSQDVGTNPLVWDGLDDSGVKVNDGKYTLDIVATRGGKTLDTSAASGLSFGLVNSVSSGAQGVKLNVQNLGALDLSTVRQIL